MRAIAFGLVQVLGALVLTAGLYRVLGLDWALVVVGALVLVGATLAEVVDGPSLRQRRITRALKGGK